jgi:hypothetical protein
MEIPLLFDGQHLTWNFLLAAIQLPIFGMDFLRQQGLLVDVGKHQIIMTASMKVIRAVAPSGGPGGLYTAVAFPSTEYGPLFAEYVTQHKEELGKHQLIMTASIRSSEWWPPLAAQGASTQQSPFPQRSMDPSLLSMYLSTRRSRASIISS